MNQNQFKPVCGILDRLLCRCSWVPLCLAAIVSLQKPGIVEQCFWRASMKWTFREPGDPGADSGSAADVASELQHSHVMWITRPSASHTVGAHHHAHRRKQWFSPDHDASRRHLSNCPACHSVEPTPQWAESQPSVVPSSKLCPPSASRLRQWDSR